MSARDYLASGFKDVDEAEDLSTYSSCLALLNSLEFFREYKDASFDLLDLEAGMNVLEAGSGIGDDALTMAGLVAPDGKVIRIDKSAHMVKEARLKLNSDIVEFEIGDINKLEFEANTFNRCRIDRTLQHLADPVRALGELYTIFKGLGLKEVQVYPRTLVVTDLSTADRVFDIFKTISKMEELEIISTGESNDLKQKLEGLDNSGAFFSSYTGFMVVGSKAW